MTDKMEALALARALGTDCGGPATAAYLRWLTETARRDNVDLLLFLPPASAALEPMLHTLPEEPRHAVLPGTELTMVLAGADFRNVEHRLDALMGAFEGRPAEDVLQRLNVAIPAEHVMSDLGLPGTHLLTKRDRATLRGFLHAYRWEILRSGQRTRGALFRHLHRLGVKPGMRIGLVEMGWDGAVIEAFAGLIDPMFGAEVLGYSLILRDTPEVGQRRSRIVLKSFVGHDTSFHSKLPDLTSNRAVVDLVLGMHGAEVAGYEDAGNDARVVIWSECDPLGGKKAVREGIRAFVEAGWIERTAEEALAPLIALIGNGKAAEREWLNTQLQIGTGGEGDTPARPRGQVERISLGDLVG